MTTEFQYLMNLSGSGAQGKKPDAPPASLDWGQISSLADEQTVLALVACAIKANATVSCPAQFRKPMIESMRSAAVHNCLRKERVMGLLKAFEDQGIHAVLLKGYAAAEEYCSAECRVCADTDIWVVPADEERACELLRGRGFEVEPRWKNGHHAVCLHPTMGCVELHVILYDEIVEDIWFNQMDGSEFVREPHERVEHGDSAYYTLGKTDHLIFLTLHMIKHFIISGMSLRMMLDVALFLKNHADAMDMARFWNTMKSLRYEECVKAILWSMVRYANFAESDLPGICPTPPEITGDILDDLELGGGMGTKDQGNREEGWHAYNREKLVREKSMAAYILYMLKWQSSNFIGTLFPSREALAERYPYVMDKPLLIPCAWIHRLVYRGLLRLKRGGIVSGIVVSEAKLGGSGRNRLEMFRRLGMI